MSWNIDQVHELVAGLQGKGVKSVRVDGEKIEIDFHEPAPVMVGMTQADRDSLDAAMESTPPKNPFDDPALFMGPPPRYQRKADGVEGMDDDA